MTDFIRKAGYEKKKFLISDKSGQGAASDTLFL